MGRGSGGGRQLAATRDAMPTALIALCCSATSSCARHTALSRRAHNHAEPSPGAPTESPTRLAQNLVDTALSPLAEASPELFLVEAPLEAPLACAAILGATWLACGLSLGLCSPASTRAGVAPAAYACIATWLASLALVGGSRLLTHTIGVAPPLAAAELNFYMGSLTALGGWRLLCAMLLPPGM